MSRKNKVENQEPEGESNENMKKHQRVSFNENVSFSDGTQLLSERLEEFANTTRAEIKAKFGKNAIKLNPIIKPEKIGWKINNDENELDLEYIWPSQDEYNFQSSDEIKNAKKEMNQERDFFYRWRIDYVHDDDGNIYKTFTNATKNIVYVAIIGVVVADRVFGAFSSTSGGKTRRKNKKCKKSRRRHRRHKK